MLDESAGAVRHDVDGRARLRRGRAGRAGPSFGRPGAPGCRSGWVISSGTTARHASVCRRVRLNTGREQMATPGAAGAPCQSRMSRCGRVPLVSRVSCGSGAGSPAGILQRDHRYGWSRATAEYPVYRFPRDDSDWARSRLRSAPRYTSNSDRARSSRSAGRPRPGLPTSTSPHCAHFSTAFPSSKTCAAVRVAAGRSPEIPDIWTAEPLTPGWLGSDG